MKSNKIVTFGEIMLRMTRPNKERIVQGSCWNGFFGGSEANVAVSLAMFGDNVEYVTRIPGNKIGEACVNDMRRYDVGTNFIVKGGDRLGLYYYEESAALRSSSIVYDREDSALTTIRPGMINWNKAFENASLFHWSGISSALSQGAADTTEESINIAERLGLTISCDINNRSNLWKYGKNAHDVLFPMAQKSDILFGTSGEWQLITGNKPPKFEAKDKFYAINENEYISYFRQAETLFSKAKKMIMVLRNTLSANHHILTGILFSNGKLYTTKIFDIDNVLDPMGVGDAFIAAYLHCYVKDPNKDLENLQFSLTASALKNTIPGDFNLVTEEEVENTMSAKFNS